ncbi:MAG: putative transporter [Candidatus Accumulibacter sp.]|jgi:putative transport protein|nr:putative transporter [Accumulibacter sp.]
MNWINDLLWGSGIAHSILLLSVTIVLGMQLGRVKVFGVSLGITLALFVGILMGHLGMRIPADTLLFFREFGLILFVFSVGMQVGPGFFASFKKGGVTLNLLAAGVVLLGALTTLVIHFVTGIPIATMVGVMSGAVTNTPGLGAAQQAYGDLFGAPDNTIALGYAVAYPLGVVGIILSLLFVRYAFRIDLAKETERIDAEAERNRHEATTISLVVKNPAIFDKPIGELARLLSHREFVISRICHHDTQLIDIVRADTRLRKNDKIFVITTQDDAETIKTFIGEEIQMDRKQWIPAQSQLVSRGIAVTKPELNGKRLGDLQLRQLYVINITRVHRSGMDLVANPALNLQLGDRLTVVGSELAINKVAEVLGNSLHRLDEPNLVTLFVGIALGIILGSVPFAFPGIPQPVKLGLAGGPLIVAILISRFGYRYKLITYITQSANLMLRELGISVFLACVGISAGAGFVDTIAHQGGLAWIGYGFLITVVPLLIIGGIGRWVCKLNYFTLIGLMAGSTTDPPALAYANTTGGSDTPSVSYATVYPLTMFLRVLAAQLMIVFFYA